VPSALTPSVFGLLGLFSWDKATQTLKAAGADNSILNGLNDYVSPFVQAFSGGGQHRVRHRLAGRDGRHVLG
jgi:hypothetical protein